MHTCIYSDQVITAESLARYFANKRPSQSPAPWVLETIINKLDLEGYKSVSHLSWVNFMILLKSG